MGGELNWVVQHTLSRIWHNVSESECQGRSTGDKTKLIKSVDRMKEKPLLRRISRASSPPSWEHIRMPPSGALVKEILRLSMW